jgi:hypothetical protein
MRTTPLINCLAVLTLLISAATLTRHAIITETACPASSQTTHAFPVEQ